MTSRTHAGQRIELIWQSTPALWAAIFADSYDGAEDSHCPMGFGKTEDEAVADLIEMADPQREPEGR